MELNTTDNNSWVIYSIAYKITKYHYSFIFIFLVKETTQANTEYDIFGPFWVRFSKFKDPPPYRNPCQYKCCSRLRDNVYFEIKVMSFRQTLLFLFLSLTVAQDDSLSLRMWMTCSFVWPPQYTLDVCNNNSREMYYNAYQITQNHYICSFPPF